MVCRNPERGEQAKQDIISESGNDVSDPNDQIEFIDSTIIITFVLFLTEGPTTHTRFVKTKKNRGVCKLVCRV